MDRLAEIELADKDAEKQLAKEMFATKKLKSIPVKEKEIGDKKLKSS
jgi:hypothetical protein